MIGVEKMFVCLDCGKIFQDPMRYTETHCLDSPPYEVYSGCPECGGAYAETYQCEDCQEWIVGEYIKTSSGYRFCENCYNTLELGDEIL